MSSKEVRLRERLDQRLHDAYMMGLRARRFTPLEMIRMADQLLDFSRKLENSDGIDH